MRCFNNYEDAKKKIDEYVKIGQPTKNSIALRGPDYEKDEEDLEFWWDDGDDEDEDSDDEN